MSSDPQHPFGTRFYAAWKAIGGNASLWSYKQIQDLKQADAAGVLSLIRQAGNIEFALIQELKADPDPEHWAEKLMQQRRQQSAAVAGMMVVWMPLLT